jgi:hypothetical protein
MSFGPGGFGYWSLGRSSDNHVENKLLAGDGVIRTDERLTGPKTIAPHSSRIPNTARMSKLFKTVKSRRGYDLKALVRLLLKSSLNKSASKKKPRKKSDNISRMTSTDRKVSISEVRCMKKCNSSMLPPALETTDNVDKFLPLRLRGGAGDSPRPIRETSECRTIDKISELEPVSFDSSECDNSTESDDFEICDDPRFESINKENAALSVFDFCDSESEHEVENFVNLGKKSSELTQSLVNSSPQSCCELKCIQNSFSDKDKEFLQLMNVKRKIVVKNELLSHLRFQEKMGLSVNGFIFNGQFLCPKTFRILSGLSEYIVNDVMDAYGTGLDKFEHGNSGGVRLAPASINLICWMKSFSNLYGQAAPDEEIIILPNFLTIKDLFEIYEDEAEAPKVKESTFYRLLENYFGHSRDDRTLPCIKIRANSTHSRCDQCIALGSFQRSSKTEEQLALAKSLKMAHKRCYGAARIFIEEQRHLAINHPESRLFIQLDDMGKSNFYIIFGERLCHNLGQP